MSNREVLLTETLRKYCKWTIKAGAKFGALPYEWSDTEGLPLYTQSQRKKMIWRFSMLYQALSTMFVGQRLLMSFVNDGPAWQKAYISALLGAYIIIIFTQTTMLVHSRSVLQIIRGCLSFYPQFEAKYCTEGSQPPQIIRALQMLLAILHFGMMQTAIGFVIPGIMFPEQAPYWTSLFFEFIPQSNEFMSVFFMSMARIMNGVMQAYVGYNFWFVPLILFVCTAFAVFPSISVVNEMREPKITRSTFQDDETQIYTYVQLTLIMDHVNSAMGMMCGGGQWAIMSLAVVSSYCLLRIGGVIGITAGAVGIFSLSSVLLVWTFLAEIGENSANILEIWKRKDWIRRSYKKKQLLRLRPLWCRVGNLYFIDIFLIMTMCKISFENVANMLMVTTE